MSNMRDKAGLLVGLGFLVAITAAGIASYKGYFGRSDYKVKFKIDLNRFDCTLCF